MKAVSREGTTLIKMSGGGEVFLADTARDIHLIYLEIDAITVNGADLLAFDSGIDWDIKKVEGVRLHGRGALQHRLPGHRLGGDPLRRAARASQHGARRPFARPAAAITWASSVQTGIKTDIKLKNFIGRGSGESVQMSFSGQGWVLVQPSEGRVQPRPRTRRRRQVASWATSWAISEGGMARRRPGRRPTLQFLKSCARLADMADPTCPVCATADIISGKWTILVIRGLAEGRSRSASSSAP